MLFHYATKLQVYGLSERATLTGAHAISARLKHASVKAGENNDEICAKYNLDRSCFS